MLQKVLAIIGCVFICLILSIGLGVGASILVDSLKDNGAETEEAFPPGEDIVSLDDLLNDSAAAETP